MQRSITQQIKDRTLTAESLARNASASEYQVHHHEWLEAAVRTGDVKFVDILVRCFPMIVADHMDGFPCSHAFLQHNLPMLEALLKAGANTRAKYKEQDLINFGLDLFLLKGSVWYSSKNWYRRCMKRVLAFRPVTSGDDETYNEVFQW
jgi:hypothetical protein